MTDGTTRLALTIAAVLWVIWGLVHALAGGSVLAADAQTGFQLIADAIDPETLVNDYAPAVGAIMNQHGWNLLWVGCATTIGAYFVWRGNITAIWVTAMLGGMFDLGYLLFVDIPGFVLFFPGTVMTFVSGSAIVLSFWAWSRLRAA